MSLSPDLADELREKSLDCVHCGLCLSSCPTYLATGREGSSPRGRIYLMRGVADGKAELSGRLADEAFLCLGCRACETACPSGVQYGAMVERARAGLVEAGHHQGLAARLERTLLRELVPHRGRLRVAMTLLSGVQRLGLVRLARRVLPQALAESLALLPELPEKELRTRLPARTPAGGESRGRVVLFEGCVMPEVFGSIQRSTVRVIARNGFEVEVPAAQGCCGALQAHAGDRVTAAKLARHNVEVLADDEAVPLILNSAGCGAALRELPQWIGAEGAALSTRVRDVCEWLDEVGMRPLVGRLDARVCYDDPCHLLHAQQVQAAPRNLLAQIPGLVLVSHADPGACCGAAGTYNLTQPEMAKQVLDRKLDSLAAADPDYIATGNPGCLMQLAAGVRRRGLRAQVVHPIELLDLASEDS